MSKQEIEFFGASLMELSNLDSINRSYVWRIIDSHVRGGDATFDHFATIIKNSLAQETEEPVILFLLSQIVDLLNKGFIYGDQMRREISSSNAEHSALSEFREQVLKVKMFNPDSSKSMKT